MIGYYVSVGYNPMFTSKAVEDKLREVVLEICADPERIIREVWTMEGISISPEFAKSYQRPWKDDTIKFIEAQGDSPFQVMQLASGSDPERSKKESMRRAFCRLVMEEMHKSRMEVSIIVA